MEQCRSFLLGKGLSDAEVEEAFRRTMNLSIRTSSMAEGKPSVQHVPSTSLVVARNTSRLLWSRLAWTICIFMVACTGTGLLFKRPFLRRIKLWIRGVVLKDDFVGKIPVVAAAVQGISAVKSASSAAMDVARANKEIMKFYIEENSQMHNIVQALETQTLELSKAMVAMKNVIMDRSNKKYLRTTKVQANLNLRNSVDVTPVQKLFGNATGSTKSRDQLADETQSRKPDRAPHSASYLEVLAILERGEKPPGILEINDKPPNPHRPPSASRLQPRPKPWEIVKVQKNDNVEGQSTYNSVANRRELLYGSYPDVMQGQSPTYISPFVGLKDRGMLPPSSSAWTPKGDISVPIELIESENVSYISSDEKLEQKETAATTTMHEPLLVSERPLSSGSEVALVSFQADESRDKAENVLSSVSSANEYKVVTLTETEYSKDAERLVSDNGTV